MRIITPFSFSDMRTLDMRNLHLQTCRYNRIRWKVAYFWRKIQTLRVNNSKILRIQNAKFWGHYFYLNTNIWRNFQICVSVPLKVATFVIFPTSIKVLLDIHQRFKGHFLNELYVSFKHCFFDRILLVAASEFSHISAWSLNTTRFVFSIRRLIFQIYEQLEHFHLQHFY